MSASLRVETSKVQQRKSPVFSQKKDIDGKSSTASDKDFTQKSKEQIEQENNILRELFGDEIVKLLLSSKFQEREDCLNKVTQLLAESSDLPKGFMIITCQLLPVEKVRDRLLHLNIIFR